MKTSMPATRWALLSVGAVFLAASLCAFPGPCRAGKAPGNALRVDGEALDDSVFLSYLGYRELKIEGLGLKERERLAREFAVDWKLAKSARKKRMEQSPEYREALWRYDMKNLPRFHFRTQFLEKAEVAESDYEPMFQGLTDEAQIEYAVLSSRPEADRFLERAREGRPFRELIGQDFRGSSQDFAGIAARVTIGDVNFTMEEKRAIFTSAPGEILGPFENKLRTFTVLRVLRLDTAEDQKKRIREEKAGEIRRNKAEAAYLSLLNQEMVRSEIEINEEYFSGGPGGEARKPYVAWVKGRYIYPRDVQPDGAHGHGGTVSRKGRRAELDDRIKEVVATEMAIQAGIVKLPGYQAMRKGAEVAILSDVLMDEETRLAALSASEEEIRGYYESRYLPEMFLVFLVRNEDREKVRLAREEILSGKAPQAVASVRSADVSRQRGGLVGYFPLHMFDADVRKAMEGLKVGELSEIFPLADGTHAIIRVEDRRTHQVPPLDEMYANVKEKVLLAKRAARVTARREGILKTTRIQVDPDRLSALE